MTTDILRDPFWQFVGAACAFAAIIIAILQWFRHPRKALSYEMLSCTPLLRREEEVKKKLQILFEEKPVKDVYLVEVKIINSGNVPIVQDDYEREVSLSFGEKAQILTAEVSEKKPNSLQASVSNLGTKVEIDRVLLNSGDWLKLKILVSKLGGIGVDGRIVGVKDIWELGGPQVWNFVLMSIGTSFAILGIVLYSLKHQVWPYFILAALGLALQIAMQVFSVGRMRRKTKVLKEIKALKERTWNLNKEGSLIC